MKWQNIYYRFIQLFMVLLFFAIVAGIYYFLSTLPPPATSPENIATLYYLDKNYQEAVEILRPIVQKEPENLDANYIYAISLYKTHHRLEAEVVFKRLLKLDPDNEDFLLGLADTQLALRRFDSALPLYEQLVKEHPHEEEYYLFLGEAYYQAGRNEKAAETFRYMIEHDLDREKATEELLALYGLPKYSSEMQLARKTYKKPAHTQYNFRTNKDFIEFRKGNAWEPVFLKGMNLSAAAPGYYVSAPPREFHVHEDWLQKIADMNCNVVRLYTLAPPAFYQALKAHNERSKKKLWLFQEVWLHVRDPRFQAIEEAFNLYDPKLESEFMHDIINVVDVIHGHADIPKVRGSTGGIYTADVSEYVVGLGLGKEVETYIASETNKLNPERTFYNGQYVSMKKGNPTEAWFAQMCDFTAYYEMTVYNAQCPLTVVNAPQFDPMYHPSEASFEEQHQWEQYYGLKKFPFQIIGFENDVVELDITRYSTSPQFPAGLFACYHSYPHWPDFMWADWKYQIAKDEEGPDPFYGYIVELKEYHKDFPLVMGEYGVSTSWYSVYNTVNSINQGGYTDQQQADLLVRWTENMFDSKYAGAVAFEFQDEWWHRSVVIADFQEPVSTPIWFNIIDAEANYGVETYDAPPPIPLLHGSKKEWKDAKKLASSFLQFHKNPGDLKSAYAYSDFSYVYIRLDIKPFQDEGWNGRQYWVALSTYPGKVGTHKLPDIGINLETGANFLIQLDGAKKSGTILIAQNYNPHEWHKIDPLVGGKRLVRKNTNLIDIKLQMPFEEIEFPTQPYHIGRDGTIYPEMHTNISELRYGTADYTSPDYLNLAAWHYDPQKGMIEIRIPWMLLYIIDPPDRGILGEQEYGLSVFDSLVVETEGIGVVAISIDAHGEVKTLPKTKKGKVKSEETPIYTWEKWVSTPKYVSRLKESYFALQKLFKTLNFQDKNEEH